MSATKYMICVGRPGEDVSVESCSEWGWSRTLERARKRAYRLSPRIRSDCRIGIVADGVVIEQSGLAPTPVWRQTRPLPAASH